MILPLLSFLDVLSIYILTSKSSSLIQPRNCSKKSSKFGSTKVKLNEFANNQLKTLHYHWIVLSRSSAMANLSILSFDNSLCHDDSNIQIVEAGLTTLYTCICNDLSSQYLSLYLLAYCSFWDWSADNSCSHKSKDSKQVNDMPQPVIMKYNKNYRWLNSVLILFIFVWI